MGCLYIATKKKGTQTDPASHKPVCLYTLPPSSGVSEPHQEKTENQDSAPQAKPRSHKKSPHSWLKRAPPKHTSTGCEAGDPQRQRALSTPIFPSSHSCCSSSLLLVTALPPRSPSHCTQCWCSLVWKATAVHHLLSQP